MTTVHAPEYYPRRRRNWMYTPDRDAFLRANATVDPALLAIDLDITERSVIQYQRKLGLRPLNDL